MARLTLPPFDFESKGLSPRAIVIFEYLLGLLIEQAAIQTGRQPRRNVPMLFAVLRTTAEQIEQRFESSARGVTIAIDASGPIGSARWELKVPDGWQDLYSTSTARLLGERAIREATAKRKSVKGKREKSALWAERITQAARSSARPDDPEETIAALQERVFDYLREAAEFGQFDTADSTVARSPSRSIVNARLRELGYTRGRYPSGK